MRAILILLAVAFAASAVTIPYPIVSGRFSGSTLNLGLKTYWKLDEIAGTRFDSEPTGTPQDLGATNNPTWTNGIFGRAAELSGSQMFGRVDSADLSVGDNSCTFAGWIFVKDLTSNRDIIGKFTSTVGVRDYVFRVSTAGNLDFIISTNGTDTTTVSTNGIVTGRWFFVAAGYDASTDKLFISSNDGGRIEASAPSGPFDSAADFGLGSRWPGPSYFNGLLDEFGIWNRALTTNEVLELYNYRFGKTCCPFQQNPNLETRLTFPGTELAEIGSTISQGAFDASKYHLRMNQSGVVHDAISAASSSYGVWGIETNNLIMEAVISMDYTNVIGGAEVDKHAMICHRLSTPWDFAGMVGFSVAGNEFQVIDRISGTEHYKRIGGLSLSYGTKYVLRITNSSSDTFTAEMATMSGTVLARTNGTFQSGVTNVGYQSAHTYGCAATLHSANVWLPDGTLVSSFDAGSRYFNPLRTTTYGSCPVTNGEVTVVSDGTGHTTNGWRAVISQVMAKDFRVDGYVRFEAGGKGGVVLRADTYGNGVWFGYDHTAKTVTLNTGSVDTSVAVMTWPATNSLATQYPFSAWASNTAIGFQLNGTTYSTNHSSYPAHGFIGLGVYQGKVAYSNLVVR